MNLLNKFKPFFQMCSFKEPSDVDSASYQGDPYDAFFPVSSPDRSASSPSLSMTSPDQPLRRHLLCCAAIVFSFACLILFGIILITEATRAAFASRVADQVLRFHVIANSDSDEDQALKLQVRDALISYMAQFHDSFDSADEAVAFAGAHCQELQQVAQTVIDRAGYPYRATASVTTCSFPEKTYGDLTFPAGDYQALRVELGQARGQNWWCVLYPLLCFTEEGMVTVPEESQEILQNALSEEDYDLLCSDDDSATSSPNQTHSPQIRFWIWEWLTHLF